MQALGVARVVGGGLVLHPVTDTGTQDRLKRVLDGHGVLQLDGARLAPRRRIPGEQTVTARRLVLRLQAHGRQCPQRLGQFEQRPRLAALELELDLADRRLGAVRAYRATIECDLDLGWLAVGVGPFDQHRLATKPGLESRPQLVGQDQASEVEHGGLIERGELRRAVGQFHLPFATRDFGTLAVTRRLERLHELAPGLADPQGQLAARQPVVVGVVVGGHQLSRAQGAAGVAAQQGAADQRVHGLAGCGKLELNLFGLRIGQFQAPRFLRIS